MGRFRRTAALGIAFVLAPFLLAPAPSAASPAAPGWPARSVRFEPLDPATTLTVDGVGTYRGAIEVRPGLHVVNDVPLDDYLRGITEVPAGWPVEAQKAQAIAARTYAVWDVAQDGEICATQDCQVYTGVRRDAPAWDAAVAQTRNQVLLYRGRPIKAMYSSSNGGASLPGGAPYLRAVNDPDDAASPLHRWRFALAPADVGRVFAMPGELFDAGRAGDSVILTSRTPDGLQHQQAIPYLDFRKRLNETLAPPPGLPRVVPSYRFTVFTNGDGVVIDGGGYGHAIGMSQFGALGKARRGWTAEQILAAYYAGLRPVTLAPEQLPATIRVALADGASRTVVRSTGRFRVLDGDGRPIAVLGTGAWTVSAARGGVRVSAPADLAGPLSFGVVGTGGPAALRVRLSIPAVVSGTADGVPFGPVLLGAGECDVPLPQPLRDGSIAVVAADAGAGRTATVEHRQPVPPPPTTAAGPPGATSTPAVGEARVEAMQPAAATRTLPAALAAGLLGGVLAMGYASRRSRSS